MIFLTHFYLMIKNYCFFKGQYLLEEEIYIHPLSPSTQYGLNVFEGIGAYYNIKNDSFYLLEIEKHLKRLFDSARRIRLNHNLKISEIEKAITTLLKKNDFKDDVYIKLVLLVSSKASWSEEANADLLIFTWEKNRASQLKVPALSLLISSWERINEKSMPPSIKSGANYMNSRYAFLEAKDLGYDLPLLINNKGFISESSGSCIISIKDEKLITPSNSSDILDSITKKMVFDFSNKILKLETTEKELTVDELLLSDEVFLCGTSIEIYPIRKINTTTFKSVTITNKLKDYFFDIVYNRTIYTEKYLKRIQL